MPGLASDGHAGGTGELAEQRKLGLGSVSAGIEKEAAQLHLTPRSGAKERCDRDIRPCRLAGARVQLCELEHFDHCIPGTTRRCRTGCLTAKKGPLRERFPAQQVDGDRDIGPAALTASTGTGVSDTASTRRC
jgi:hypothetical protein